MFGFSDALETWMCVVNCGVVLDCANNGNNSNNGDRCDIDGSSGDDDSNNGGCVSNGDSGDGGSCGCQW